MSIRTNDSNENKDDKGNGIAIDKIAQTKINIHGQLEPIIDTCSNTYGVVLNEKNETIIVTASNTHIVLLNCNVNQLLLIKHDFKILELLNGQILWLIDILSGPGVF